METEVSVMSEPMPQTTRAVNEPVKLTSMASGTFNINSGLLYYVDGSNNSKKIQASQMASEIVNNAVSIAKGYTDTSVRGAISTAVSQAVSQASGYTDGIIENALSQAYSYTDTSVNGAISTAVSQAHSYTDEQISRAVEQINSGIILDYTNATIKQEIIGNLNTTKPFVYIRGAKFFYSDISVSKDSLVFITHYDRLTAICMSSTEFVITNKNSSTDGTINGISTIPSLPNIKDYYVYEKRDANSGIASDAPTTAYPVKAGTHILVLEASEDRGGAIICATTIPFA